MAPRDTNLAEVAYSSRLKPEGGAAARKAAAKGASRSMDCQGCMRQMAAAMARYSAVHTAKPPRMATGRSLAGLLACTCWWRHVHGLCCVGAETSGATVHAVRYMGLWGVGRPVNVP